MGRFISDEDRHRLATGWDPRVSTLREYARSVGVSERAIRLWRARLRHEGGITFPGGNDAMPLQAIVNALQQRLAELDAAVDGALAAAAAARATLDALAAHADLAGGTDTAGDAAPSDSGPLAPIPMPASGFSWF